MMQHIRFIFHSFSFHFPFISAHAAVLACSDWVGNVRSDGDGLSARWRCSSARRRPHALKPARNLRINLNQLESTCESAGGARCADIVASGGCYDAAPAGYCQATCGVCSGAGLPCTDKPWSITSTCQDMVAWGLCNATWAMDAKYCRAACGTCAGPPPPPRPPSPSPPPPQAALTAASWNSGPEGFSVGLARLGCSGACWIAAS
jgi:hypothetical protein